MQRARDRAVGAALLLAVLSLGASPAAAQHAGTTLASGRASAGFVAFPELGDVGVSFEAVVGANVPIWSVDEPAPREGWGMSLEGGVLINAGDQLGLVVHGVVTMGFDYQFEWLAIGPIATAFVGWGPSELSAGGRLGLRVEALFGILGVDLSVDGRGYGGRALFGPDVRFALDLGAAIHLLVGVIGGGGRHLSPPPTGTAEADREECGELPLSTNVSSKRSQKTHSPLGAQRRLGSII